MERGPSIHFRIDGPDHLYGFRSKLKHRIFWEDGKEIIDRGREKLVTFGKLSVNFRKLSGKTLKDKFRHTNETYLKLTFVESCMSSGSRLERG